MPVVADRHHLALCDDITWGPEPCVDAERDDVHPVAQTERIHSFELARPEEHHLHGAQQGQRREPTRPAPRIVEQPGDDPHERRPQQARPPPCRERHGGAGRRRDDHVGRAQHRYQAPRAGEHGGAQVWSEMAAPGVGVDEPAACGGRRRTRIDLVLADLVPGALELDRAEEELRRRRPGPRRLEPRESAWEMDECDLHQRAEAIAR